MYLHLILCCGLIALQTAARQTTKAPDWGYVGEIDPLHWSDNYKNCEKTNNQSPINFKLETIETDDSLEEIVFVNYDELPVDQAWTVWNNGHTVVLKADFESRPQLQRGGLNAKYDFHSLHFHWGATDFVGSEHHVGGHMHPLEMHIVHTKNDGAYNRARPGTLQLAVVGVFFQLGESDDSIAQIADALPDVEAPDAKAILQIEALTLDSLLPRRHDYYRYSGSLTTPPCDATVQWSVLQEAITVSPAQLKAFRNLKAHLHKNASQNGTVVLAGPLSDRITSNYRPTQPLGDRKVFQYTAAVALNKSAPAPIKRASKKPKPTVSSVVRMDTPVNGAADLALIDVRLSLAQAGTNATNQSNATVGSNTTGDSAVHFKMQQPVAIDTGAKSGAGNSHATFGLAALSAMLIWH